MNLPWQSVLKVSEEEEGYIFDVDKMLDIPIDDWDADIKRAWIAAAWNNDTIDLYCLRATPCCAIGLSVRV